MSNHDDRLVAELNRMPATDASGDVDLGQIRFNLSLTPAERVLQNDRWAKFVRIAREAGRAFYAEKG